MRTASYHAEILLTLDGPMTVQRVFPRAWHLLTGDGFVVSVSCAPYNGPLGVRVERPGLEDLPVRLGMRAQFQEEVLQVGRVRVELEGAVEWRPRAPHLNTPHSQPRARAGFAGFHGPGRSSGYPPGAAGKAPPLRIPVKGRGEIGREISQRGSMSTVGDGVLAATALIQIPPLPLRERGLGGEGYDGLVSSLLGLGPGLTPAGDDFLCGYLAGLRILGTRASVDTHDLVERLSAEVDALAPFRTTALSRTLLYYAGRGTVVEPLEEFLFSLDIGGGASGLDGSDRARRRLLAIGHTSGRDMLAGALSARRTIWEREE